MPAVIGWENFFVAEAGAAAALSGLLFVAVSINLSRILAVVHLPERAGEALLVLLAVLAVSTFGLMPRQTATAFGVEVAATGMLTWGYTVWQQLRAYRGGGDRRWLANRALSTQLPSAAFVFGGVSLVTKHDGWVYWIVAGVLASFGSGIYNAWVLLIEILR